MKLHHLAAALMTGLPATALHAQPAVDAGNLVRLVNAYRAAPGICQGRPKRAAAPLQPERALSRIRISTGTFLEQSLEDSGYPVERAQAISVTGPADADSAFAQIEQRYCAVLLDRGFSAVGAQRNGDEWQLVLARPLPPVRFSGQEDAGQRILELVNAARAAGQMCGSEHFDPAPPLRWNPMLAAAALEHSKDMALHRYFEHRGSDGTVVGDRVSKAGYSWRRVGENIASGTRTPEEAVQGWLDSPGHCANVMGPFSEMGTGYALNPKRKTGTAYWTQVFANPR
ncbi:CAP domain-containing protein [Massilia terrae]